MGTKIFLLTDEEKKMLWLEEVRMLARKIENKEDENLLKKIREKLRKASKWELVERGGKGLRRLGGGGSKTMKLERKGLFADQIKQLIKVES